MNSPLPPYGTNRIDIAILRRVLVDPDQAEFLLLISSNDILKGVFVVALFWAMWFSRKASSTTRNQIAAVAAISIVAIALGRLLALSMPFRVRPRFETAIPDNPFPPLSGTPADFFTEWSSMPSDHALLYFALATGLFLISRLVGAIALLHALLVISLPRVCLWLHYPSDIFAGAVIGVVLTLILFRPAVFLAERIGIARMFDHQPAIMYPLMFFASFQIASNFESLRQLLVALLRGLLSTD